jgi:glycosyltransferase involved in cell wall biosynthesis
VYVEHGGRVIARNVGMRKARGEWICWLDSDDAYDPMYLTTFGHNIRKEPEARLWVCGAVYHGMEGGKLHICPKWTKIRPAWMPPVNTDGGHDHFPSGKVGTGMFVFARSCLDVTGLMPEWKTSGQIADGVNEWLNYDTGYSSARKEVGNPFGDDWAMLRRLTQFYRVHLIDAALYVQYVRSGK